jgi:hypothetical protein
MIFGGSGFQASIFNQTDYLFQNPDVIGKACVHRRSHAQCRVNLAKIVVHEINRQHVAHYV